MGAIWFYLSNSLHGSTAEEILWLFLLYVLCCLPAVLFIAGHRLRIPVMPLWGAGYFMLFGMPFFGKGPQETLFSMSPALVQDALQLIVMGACCCLIAFYTPLGRWVESASPSFQAPWDLNRAPKSGVLLCLLGMVTYYAMKVLTPAAGLQQLLSNLSLSATLGMLTLFLLQLRGKLTGRLKFFLWGIVFPFQYILTLGTGSVFNTIIVLAPFLFCYTAERRKVPMVWGIILVCVLIVPFLGYKAEYRSYAWSGENVDPAVVSASPLEKGLFFVQLVTRRISEGGLESYNVAMETAQERASQTGLLARVMELTPSQIPFWKGETYATLLWLFVPRFLYPAKPIKTIGQEFGHRYGILHEEDYWTSINLPHQVVEMYLNFGVAGVILGMMLMGFLYRVVAFSLGRPGSGERMLLIGCTLCTALLNMDNDFSLVFGGVVYCFGMLYLVSNIFHGNVAAPGKAASAV